MKIKIPTFLIALLLLSISSAASQARTQSSDHRILSNGMHFIVTNQTPNEASLVSIEKYASYSVKTAIVIPTNVIDEKGESYTVTEIGDGAMANCYQTPLIILPKTIKKIGVGAFSNCYGLKTVCIPSSVKSIGDYAFSGCGNIVAVTTGIKQPFDMGYHVFSQKTKKQAVLIVPHGKKQAYRKAIGWEFFNIIEAEGEDEIEEDDEPSLYDLALWSRNGSICAAYALREKPKITFTPSSIIIATKDYEVETYNIDDIAKFTYELPLSTAVQDIFTDSALFKINEDAIMFPSLKENSTIHIVTLNGNVVLNKRIPQSGEYALPISNLAKGVYMIYVNGSTFKMIKK